MADVKWIKITTSMFDDEKIRIIESMPDADAILVIWIKLLTLAGKNNTNGFIFLSENIPYTDEMLSTIFNRPLNTVRLALQTFKQFGMIDFDENSFLFLVNWDKHQNIEGLEKIREQTRKRVAKHRENQKALPSDVTLPVTQCNATEKNKNRTEKKENIYSADFETFWKKYPKKKSKGQAEKAWKNMKPDTVLVQEIMSGLEKAIASYDWKKEGGKFIPYPATWLNAKGWLDEYSSIPFDKSKTQTNPRAPSETLSPATLLSGGDEIFLLPRRTEG